MSRMTPDKRKKLLATGLALTLLATLYAYFDEVKEQQEFETVEVNDRPVRTIASASQGKQHGQARYGERFLQAAEQDIFQAGQPVAAPEVQNVDMPAVAPPMPALQQMTAAVVEPAAPVAPPLPFTYIGKYIEDGQLNIFLGYRGANLVVKAGDVIQQTYKVESIKPPLMTLRYMPMDVPQNLQIGELQ